MPKLKIREDLMNTGFECGGVKMLPWGDFSGAMHQMSQLNGSLVGIVYSGNLRFSINGEVLNVSENQMFVLNNDVQISDIKASKACRGYLLILKNKYFAMMDVPTSDMWIADLIVRTTHVFDVEESLREMMHNMVVGMCAIANNNSLYCQSGALLSVAMSFCYVVLSIILSTVDANIDAKDNRSYNSHMKRFIELLSKEHMRERSVEYYATQLGITPKYLTMICRKYRGMTASQIIDNIVIHNAMRLLRQPDVSMQQVAQQLNFPSQSFFGKYFKQRVGISPSRYKNNPNY